MSIRWRRLVLVAMLAFAAFPIAARFARAADPLMEPDGPRRLVRYTGCASALALASTFTQAYSAILLCINVVLDEVQTTP